MKPILHGSKINTHHQGSHTAMPTSRLGMRKQLGELQLDHQRDITMPQPSNKSCQRDLKFVSTAIAQELLGIGQLAVRKFSFNNFSWVCFPFKKYLLSYHYFNPHVFLLLPFQFSPPSHKWQEERASSGTYLPTKLNPNNEKLLRSHQHSYPLYCQRILKMQLKIKSNYFPWKDYLSKISISKVLYSVQRYSREIQLISWYKFFLKGDGKQQTFLFWLKKNHFFLFIQEGVQEHI